MRPWTRPKKKWPWLTEWFLSYTRCRWLRRSFHAIRLLGDLPQLKDDGRTPLLACLNHSSWWDVLVAAFVERELFGWDAYGVMDARQLARYSIFTHMGMVGVDRTCLAGAREFLRMGQMLLRGQRRALWLTPQGAMVSSYQRPIRFQPGIGSLATRLDRFYLVHVTLHYEFWDERLPEAFVAVSEPEVVEVCASRFDQRAFVRRCELSMEAQLDALLSALERRDPQAFRTLLWGASGTTPAYDVWRALKARRRGEIFSPEHGHILTPSWRRARRDRDRK